MQPTFILISILIHASIMFVLSLQHENKQEVPPPPPQAINVRLVEKQEEKISPKTNEELAPIPATPDAIANVECRSFYYGIGYIGYMFADDDGLCIVDSVMAGYPAQRAGIQAKDKIEPSQGLLCPGKGPEGEIVTVIVHRGTGKWVATMRREKICTAE